MSLFQSEKMAFYSLIMPKESSLEILNYLGSKSLLQILSKEDQPNFFHQPFLPQMKRCDDLLIKLDFIENEIKNSGREIFRVNDFQAFSSFISSEESQSNLSHSHFFEREEGEIMMKYNFLNNHLKQFDEIISRLYQLEYSRMTLLFCKETFLDNKYNNPINNILLSEASLENSLGDKKDFEFSYSPDIKSNKKKSTIHIENSHKNVHLSYLTGVINKVDALAFKRMVFRATKGNTFTFIEDVHEGMLTLLGRQNRKEKALEKNIFLLIFQGGSESFMKKKLVKICDSFHAIRIEIPETEQVFKETIEKIENGIQDSHNVYILTKNEIESCLDSFSSPEKNSEFSLVERYKIFIWMQKTLYKNMNLLKEKNHVCHCFVWSPKENEELIYEALQEISQKSKHIVTGQLQEAFVEDNMKPPTYFKTNEFTSVFQDIVNTYGIPRYREVNPGLFTIILFPFLFGVMFGDIGHGFLLFLLGIYLISMSKKINKGQESLLGSLMPFRYLLALMGFFATYCGFIYNDLMSISLDFGSCYKENNQMIERKVDEECTYTFGIDPIWYSSKNSLAFINSFKMKLAVTIGVIQMGFGIILKGINNINDLKLLDFFFEFLPQLVLLLSLFGYMIFLIVIKWLTDWSAEGTDKAPGIINLMINMPLKLGGIEGNALWGDKGEEENFQFILLIIATCSIFVMLLFKPILNHLIKYAKAQSRGNLSHAILSEEEDLEDREEKMVRAKSDHDELPFGEAMVFQTIETIEFTLGTISNTASYLRLWALSLAHSQLSEVFFERILKPQIEEGNFIGIIIGFLIFANVSFAVLMCMDAMECFLHALRLQWVEWQNKFFKADGYKYEPFSFENSIRI